MFLDCLPLARGKMDTPLIPGLEGCVYTSPRPCQPMRKSRPTGPYHFIIGPVVCHREDSLAPTSDVVQIKQHCHVAVRQGGLLSGSPIVGIPTCGHSKMPKLPRGHKARQTPQTYSSCVSKVTGVLG